MESLTQSSNNEELNTKTTKATKATKATKPKTTKTTKTSKKSNVDINDNENLEESSVNGDSDGVVSDYIIPSFEKLSSKNLENENEDENEDENEKSKIDIDNFLNEKSEEFFQENTEENIDKIRKILNVILISFQDLKKDFDKKTFSNYMDKEDVKNIQLISKLYFNFQLEINDILTLYINSSKKTKSKSKLGDQKTKLKVKKENSSKDDEPMSVYPEVLKFLKLDEETLVSRADIRRNICSFVKNEKEASNPDIVLKGDNKSFNLIGDLKIFFDFIKSIMLERGDLVDENNFPTKIYYIQIMKYLKYCFPLK
jgi:hypothetical protein